MKNVRVNRIARQIADLQQQGASPSFEVMECYESAKRDAYISTEIERAQITALTVAEGVCLSMRQMHEANPTALSGWQIKELDELRRSLRKLDTLKAEQSKLYDSYKRELDGLI